VASMNIPPDLVELPNVNSRTATTTNFTTIAVPVLDWDQIKTELEADGTRTLVARAGAPVAGGNAPTVDIHQVLPVPASIAALYLTPTPVRAAFLRGQTLREIIPENKRGNFGPLFNFLRAAATRGDTHVDRPSSQSAWAKLVVGANTPMEVRYARMVGKLLPKETPSSNPATPNNAPPPPPPPAPTPGTTTEKYKYHDFQCRVIWSASGKLAANFAVLTESSLPDFFQGLKEHRGSNIVARQYIESQWSGHKSSERMPTPFVWSAQLIKDVRNLDFGASDISETNFRIVFSVLPNWTFI